MSLTPLWNPHSVLRLGPLLNRKTCQGYSNINSPDPTKCRLHISENDSIEADDMLEYIALLEPSSRAVEQSLVLLARFLLCSRWHRDDDDQVAELVGCWRRRIRAFETTRLRAATARRVQEIRDSPVQQFINDISKSLEQLALNTNCQVPVSGVDRRNTIYRDANNHVFRPIPGEARSLRQSGSLRGQNSPTNTCRSKDDCLICWDECKALASCPNPRCKVTMHRKCLDRYHSDRENPNCPHW